jgi:HEPN domain-containing protein
MSSPEENVLPWLRKVDNDLLNIENNLAAKHIPWDTVCFHAQQAAEKLLKAFLISRGRDLMRTHDLIALLTECVELYPSLANLEDDCRNLTYFAVSARYPGDVYEPGEQDGREMIAAMQRVRTQILALIPEKGQS